MPLKKGTSNKVISSNVREMVRDVKEGDGKIGRVKPKSLKHAQKIAVAIALKKAGKGNPR